MAFPDKSKSKDKPKDKDKQARQDKIKGMSKLQRSKDLETSWRTGKTPASGYSEDDDPNFASADDMAGGAAPGADDDDQTQGQLPGDDPEVMYMGPENGPFMCSNCVYFMGDNQPCQKVSDPVNAEGCCNQFQPAGGDQGAQGIDQGPPPGGPATPPPNGQGAF